MFLRNKTAPNLTDEELVARLRAGDRSSLGVLWDRYAHLLFGVAMKYLKDVEAGKDAVMGLFAELPALIGKHEVKRFRPWLHAVMRNRCLMVLRKADPLVRMDPALIEQEDQGGEAALHEASLQELEAAIAQLPEGQEACIRLFYLERNSYQQVAERTGYPLEQVRSHLQNGRRNLRISLERHGPQH
ncbi:MAG: sigma-70 family RNA polymerase sigma factor [Flavobacteriales bacterium]|jgi:RNA polymerase sigma-70 factor (ECF subfamily)|nr:sigma-70 family RNA polymerase sigma factor [Flavobacteriales bacterium]MBK7249028.1 sigma-70 family RNA polymerase sigma factor [Flavobacteriales bacterium]MBK9058729.1 sigma-70 family RNA polymerase sigma factor [Flavobacteriales bacterium]QQS71275.1 MAG: sigma-70 family RNA polymerase sigma factor [Flavobacteriales bacterium]HQV39414.1 sigma-70 family RNA polymerase sigma factor [Flavobacteriales bacterium]